MQANHFHDKQTDGVRIKIRKLSSLLAVHISSEQQQTPTEVPEERALRAKCYVSVRRRFEDELLGSLWGESASSWNGDSALSRALRRRPMPAAGVTFD